MLCPRCHRWADDPDARACRFDGEPLSDLPPLALISAQPTDEAGAVYDERYIVRGLLGKGSMGRIFLAENTSTHEPVAIKVLESKSSRAQDLRDRFMREVKVVESLEHPNIVRSLDAGTRQDGTPYLVLEYLYGEPLRAFLERESRLDTVSIVWVARQVASALAAAHAAGIVHRDVKADNVFLVGERGRPHTVKLVDFGLGRFQDASALTAVNVTVGTLEYMAPEQLLKDATGPRTDIYSLGVVMYRMMTGGLPFMGTDTEVLAQQLIYAPRPPTEFVTDADPRLEAIILTALRKLPRNRYPAIQDMLEDLERLAGERDGELCAGEIWEPDVYRPHNPYSKTIALSLYKKIGLEPPSWDD